MCVCVCACVCVCVCVCVCACVRACVCVPRAHLVVYDGVLELEVLLEGVQVCLQLSLVV